MMESIDWGQLQSTAELAMTRAYAPYSKHRVGVAGLTADGRVVTGFNVENHLKTNTIHAEESMVAELFKGQQSQLVGVVCVSEKRGLLVPCGSCRQLLFEHSGPETLFLIPAGVVTMAELLPYAYAHRA